MATDPASEPTFIAALRDDGIHALGVTDGSMDMGSFELCVEAILAPALEEGDIVILDNLAAHGSAKAAKILESIGPGGTFSMMELLRAIRVEPSRANQIRVAAYLKENLGFEKSVQKRRNGGRPKLWTVPEHIRPVDNSLADRKDPQSQDE